MSSLGLDLRTTVLRRAVDFSAQFTPDRSPGTDGAAILASSSVGSVGDDAMLTALSTALGARGVSRQVLFGFAPMEEPFARAIGERIDVSGFVMNSSLRNLMSLAPTLRSVAELHMIGADMMDGWYSVMGTVKRILLAAFAARLGVRVTIAGFSFNPNPPAQVVRTLQMLPASVRLCARDPISAERLEAILPDRQIRRVADLAFLLEPDASSEQFRDTAAWIESAKAEGSVVLGINVAALTDTLGDALIERHVEAVRQLAGGIGRIAVLLIPHDFKETGWTASDIQVAARLEEKLKPLLGDRVRTLQAPFRASLVKALCGHLDALLTGRMHCAIAGLGRGLPVACIVYQGKFEGLYDHFGLPRDLLLEREAAAEPGAVAALAERLVRDRLAIRASVQEALPSVMLRSRDNLAVD